MLTNIKAAIFDLDGTLIDSMWVWEKLISTTYIPRAFKCLKASETILLT